MGYCLDLPNWTEIFGQWLYNWQTLIAGTFAFGAAWIGFLAVTKQTRQASGVEAAKLQRQHRAECAVLPLILDDVCRACHAALNGNGFFLLPVGATDRLNSFANSTDDVGLSALVHKICSDIQVRLARQRRVGWVADHEAFLDLAEIHALSERLLRYSRDAEGAPFIVEWERVQFALENAGLNQLNQQAVFTRLVESRNAREHYWQPSQ